MDGLGGDYGSFSVFRQAGNSGRPGLTGEEINMIGSDFQKINQEYIGDDHEKVLCVFDSAAYGKGSGEKVRMVCAVPGKREIYCTFGSACVKYVTTKPVEDLSVEQLRGYAGDYPPAKGAGDSSLISFGMLSELSEIMK